MYGRPLSDASLVACPGCDLLQRLATLPEGGALRCQRCDEELWRSRPASLERTLALALAATILYAVANLVPMLGLTAVGRAASTTVFGGALHLWNNGREVVAVLVLFTAVVAPALQIGFALSIAIGGRATRPARWVGLLLRHHPSTATWSMIEVMLLGVLVALVKIADYATVVPGAALYALGLLVFVLAAMQSSLDYREIWERIEWASGRAPARESLGTARGAAS